jgi:hypothetical protein
MRSRSEVRLHLLAFLASWGVACLVTWPAIADLSGGLIGHPGNDTWNHAWGFWWFLDGVMRRGGIPFQTGILNYPTGGTLFFIDGFNALISIPLQLVTGSLPISYNLVVIGCVAWSIFGMWALAHHVLRDVVPAAVAAVIFGCGPHLLGQTYNGITETVNAGWIPLYALALLRLLERPRPGRGLALGLALAACALSNFYYGLFGVLLSVVIVVHQGITDPWRVRWKPFVAYTALGAAVFSALVIPVLRTLSATMDAPDAMVNRDPDFVWESLLRHNMTDVVSFFRPGRFYSPDLKALYGEDLLIVIYLGWAALGLAGFGVLMHRRRRELSLWAWVFGIFLVFSLGPYLYINGGYLRFDGRMIPLPFLPFFKAFPLFSRISHPFRFVVPATLGLSILSGHGVRLLLRGLPRAARYAGGAALAAVVLAEILLASPAVWPMPRSDAKIPEVYSTMTGDGAVLDLPITVPNLERAVYTYYQTAHGRPSPYGLNDPMPASLARNRLTWLLVNLEAGYQISLPRLLPELELVHSTQLLKAQGYRYIVVHEKLYTLPKREMIETLLTAVVGPPRKYPDDGVSLYEL